MDHICPRETKAQSGQAKAHNAYGLKTNQPWGSFALAVRHHYTMTKRERKQCCVRTTETLSVLKTAVFFLWNNQLIA